MPGVSEDAPLGFRTSKYRAEDNSHTDIGANLGATYGPATFHVLPKLDGTVIVTIETPLGDLTRTLSYEAAVNTLTELDHLIATASPDEFKRIPLAWCHYTLPPDGLRRLRHYLQKALDLYKLT